MRSHLKKLKVIETLKIFREPAERIKTQLYLILYLSSKHLACSRENPPGGCTPCAGESQGTVNNDNYWRTRTTFFYEILPSRYLLTWPLDVLKGAPGKSNRDARHLVFSIGRPMCFERAPEV